MEAMYAMEGANIERSCSFYRGPAGFARIIGVIFFLRPNTAFLANESRIVSALAIQPSTVKVSDSPPGLVSRRPLGSDHSKRSDRPTITDPDETGFHGLEEVFPDITSLGASDVRVKVLLWQTNQYRPRWSL